MTAFYSVAWIYSNILCRGGFTFLLLLVLCDYKKKKKAELSILYIHLLVLVSPRDKIPGEG